MSALPTTPTFEQPIEQLRYARWLDALSRIGFLVLVVTFVLYVTGLMPARVPVDRLPEYWVLSVGEFLQRTDAPSGWAWVGLLGHGDFIGLVGIALLAACSLPCLLVQVPLYWRRADMAFVWLCFGEVVVILLAASGVFAQGH